MTPERLKQTQIDLPLLYTVRYLWSASLLKRTKKLTFPSLPMTQERLKPKLTSLQSAVLVTCTILLSCRKEHIFTDVPHCLPVHHIPCLSITHNTLADLEHGGGSDSGISEWIRGADAASVEGALGEAGAKGVQEGDHQTEQLGRGDQL